MTWRLFLLVLMVQLSWFMPASAGIFFHKTKTDPAQRVPELIGILRSDPSDDKREAAAEELRQYDPKTYPDIVPALTQALQSDSKSAVRAEAAQSLGKLRPISQEAGQALQIAASSDAALRVRLQARSSLLHYQMGGFRSKVTGPELGPINQEPPLASSPVATSSNPPMPTQPRIAPIPAPSASAPKLVPHQTSTAQPMPVGTPTTPLVPTDPPHLRTPPQDDGPVLDTPF